MMGKHNFKIGDKVKLKSEYTKYFKQGTKVGEIIDFSGSYIRVKYIGKDNGFPYKPHEIERAARVGEQLMLFEL